MMFLEKYLNFVHEDVISNTEVKATSKLGINHLGNRTVVKIVYGRETKLGTVQFING